MRSFGAFSLFASRSGKRGEKTRREETRCDAMRFVEHPRLNALGVCDYIVIYF